MIYAVICVSVGLLFYAIATLIQYILLTERLKKRIDRDMKRLDDRIEARKKYEQQT